MTTQDEDLQWQLDRLSAMQGGRGYDGGGEVMSDESPEPVEPGQQYAENLKQKVAGALAQEAATRVGNAFARRPIIGAKSREYPDVWDSPKSIVEKAVERAKAPPEDPALFEVFGVTRDDLYEMGKDRVGNTPGSEFLKMNPNARGSRNVKGIMTPANTQRIIDILEEAGKYPELHKGMDSWYVADPIVDHLERTYGPGNFAKVFDDYRTMSGIASSMTTPVKEIERGPGAWSLAKQGRWEDFVKYGAKEGMPGAPADMAGFPGGGPSHTTNVIGGMRNYLETGEHGMDSAKIPAYVGAFGSPKVRFQTDLAVGDSHIARGSGLADMRPYDRANPLRASGHPKAKPGGAIKMTEFQTFGPWFRDDIAAPMGQQSIPMQGRMWGALSDATGVAKEAAIGAPKLELIARHIKNLAAKHGIPLDVAKQMHLTGGELFAEGGQVKGPTPEDDYPFRLRHLQARRMEGGGLMKNVGEGYGVLGTFLSNTVSRPDNYQHPVAYPRVAGRIKAALADDERGGIERFRPPAEDVPEDDGYEQLDHSLLRGVADFVPGVAAIPGAMDVAAINRNIALAEERGDEERAMALKAQLAVTVSMLPLAFAGAGSLAKPAASWLKRKMMAPSGPVAEQIKRLAAQQAARQAERDAATVVGRRGETLYATHEAQPGAEAAMSGHLPGSLTADERTRAAFAANPLSTWANAPGGRDAIYAGYAPPGGRGLTVDSTLPMQGVYQPKSGGPLETNLGYAARPRVTVEEMAGGVRRIAPEDQMIANTAEAIRAYGDAQNVSAATAPLRGTAKVPGDSLLLPDTKRASLPSLLDLQNRLTPHNLGDVLDTGEGMVATNFMGTTPMDDAAIKAALPPGRLRERIQRGGVYQDMENEFKQGVGSGAATKKLIDIMEALPKHIREGFANNAMIGQNALNRLARDKAWSAHWGGTREDIDLSRAIMGKDGGANWYANLKRAYESGAILPATFLAVMAAAQSEAQGEE